MIPDFCLRNKRGAFGSFLRFNGKLTLSNSTFCFGSESFSDCSTLIVKLTIPNGTKIIENCALFDCKGFDELINIYIEFDAFKFCTEFSGSLSIPLSYKSIENGTFLGCSKILSSTLELILLKKLKYELFVGFC